MKVVKNLRKFSVEYFPGKYPGYGSVDTLQNITLQHSERGATGRSWFCEAY